MSHPADVGDLLPDQLENKQKINKIDYLLKRLRISGKINNETKGSDSVGRSENLENYERLKSEQEAGDLFGDFYLKSVPLLRKVVRKSIICFDGFRHYGKKK